MSEDEEPQVEEQEADEEAFLPEEEGEFSPYEDVLREIGVTADEDGIHIPEDVLVCLQDKENEPDDVKISSASESSLLILLTIPEGDKSYTVRCDLSVEAMKEMDKLENYGFYLDVVGEDVLDEDTKDKVLDSAEVKLASYLRSCKQQGGRRRKKATKKNKKKSKGKKRTFRKTK